MIKNNSVNIRKITDNELSQLEEMLYEAIFQPEGAQLLPKEIIEVPEIKVYIDNFGQKKR